MTVNGLQFCFTSIIRSFRLLDFLGTARHFPDPDLDGTCGKWAETNHESLVAWSWLDLLGLAFLICGQKTESAVLTQLGSIYRCFTVLECFGYVLYIYIYN